MFGFSFNQLKLIQLTALALFSLWSINAAAAESCQSIKLSGKSIERWYNPHPSPNDFKLPMSLGMALVFSPIPLGTKGLYGDEKSTYVMGSATPRLFETNLEVRVGSSISQGGEARFLFGKYEITKAQYVAVMGSGALDAGIKILVERSRDPRTRKFLSKFISGPCKGVLTQAIYDFLSEPLTFLSYRDYIEFLDTYNLYCISRNDCRRKLSELGPNKDVPGFVRLPAEHEWEFVARGGQEFAAGGMSKTEFQTDLPRTRPGKTIKHHAHVGSDPSRPLPIGSREPLFGIYDMLGNAQELMLNPFTAENGFGAVGAYVARGGHFRLAPKELRVSRRVELQAFRLDEATNSFVIQYFPLTGIRTVIGYPVIGAAQRLGDASLVQDFVENYEPPGEAGDIAGATHADARDLGVLGDKGISTNEELSSDDEIDYFKVSLRSYSTIAVKVSSDASILYEVTNESQETVSKGKSGGSVRKSAAVLPGDYWIKLTPANRLKTEKRYRVNISRSLEPDTGVGKLDPAELKNARSLSQSLRYSGYVGSGDTVDTYPIRDDSRVGGIELKVDSTTAPVELTYVDEKLNVVRRAKADPASGKLVMNLNSDYGRRGFVQISAAANSATTYNLNISVKEPYSRIFKKSIVPSVSAYGAENEHFEGNLDRALPALFLPIQINEPKILKLELTDLSADVDLKVLKSDKTAIASSHVRSGTSPEFFSKPVDAGVYFAEVRLKSTRDISQFRLLYSTEKLPNNNFTSYSGTANRSSAKDWGILGLSGISDALLLDEISSYFRFEIRGTDKHVRIELKVSFSLDPASPDLYLEDHQGNTIARSINNSEVAILDLALSSGTYYLRLERASRASLVSLYLISIVASSSTTDPDFSRFGNLVEFHRDFQIYRDGNDCTLITVAKRFSPSTGWRSTTPYFGIGVERNKDTVSIWMENTSPETRYDLYRSGSVRADILGYGNITVEWSANSYLLQPLDSTGRVSIAAIEGFIKGRALVISGRTPANQMTRIEYSLLGYKKAAQRINQLCRARADWIWQQ